MLKQVTSLLIMVLLSGCSINKTQSEYQISLVKNQQSDNAFSYAISFEHNLAQTQPSSKAKRKRLNPNRVQSSDDVIAAKKDNILMLEQKAVKLLEVQLQQKAWCISGYIEDERFWRDNTFRLIGHCII